MTAQEIENGAKALYCVMDFDAHRYPWEQRIADDPSVRTCYSRWFLAALSFIRDGFEAEAECWDDLMLAEDATRWMRAFLSPPSESGEHT